MLCQRRRVDQKQRVKHNFSSVWESSLKHFFVPTESQPRPQKPVPISSTFRMGPAEKVERAAFMRSLLPGLTLNKFHRNNFSDLPDTLESFLGTMKNLTHVRDDSRVVGHDGIQSLSWHPSSEKLLLAAGDKRGFIGLFYPSMVSCLKFLTSFWSFD